MLHYTFDESLIDIKEIVNPADTAYQIVVKSEDMRKRLKQVRSYFDENKDYTDVLFYSHEDGSYEVIVRKDMIPAFLMHAFRFQCLKSLQWN